MKNIILTLVVSWSLSAIAQETPSDKALPKKVLTIDECIVIAMENNTQLKLARNNAAIAKSNDFQAIMNFLPSVNGAINYQWNSGSSFDNSSGQFFTGEFQNSSPGVRANWTLFNGLNNMYYKKITSKSLEANTSQILAQQQDVQSSVLGTYLSVVLDKENITIAKSRVALLQAQLEREEKRYSVGVGNLEQVYNFKSQLANENLGLVNRQNQLMSDMLTLIQVLQLDVSGEYDVAAYEFNEGQNLMTKDEFNDVLNASLVFSPTVKSAEANAEMAHYNFKSTQTGMMPSLNLIGQYGTQYSSNNADANGEIPISNQYENLTFKSLNVQLSVPIFNNYRSRTGTQVARINMENAKLNLEQTELDVTNTIQRVYIDLVSAQETYKAANENLIALNQSFEYVKTSYEHGTTDFYTYLESLNNKNRAEIQSINAKYSIVFRKKILDVYRGLL